MSHAIGISFGLEYVSVSKACKDDTVDHVGSHTTSSAYRELFQRVLDERVPGNLDACPGEAVPDTHLIPPKSDDAETIFHQEFQKVLSIIGTRLDSTDFEPAISVPYHWNETVQRAVFKAAEGAKIPLAGIHMLLRLPRALEKAYQLDSDTVFDDYFFIVVDYNRTYLHLLICETARDGGYGIVENQVQFAHLGENSSSKSGYHEEVLESIQKFLSLSTTKDNFSTVGKIPDRDIKAAMLSGNASAEWLQKMRNILQQIVGRELLYSSCPPLYAAAVGAARAAKLQIENPKSTKDFVSMPEDIPDEPRV